MTKPILAVKTLEAIDNMIAADQGSAFRGWLGKVIPHIGDAYRTDDKPFRPHLGASLIGRECGREIWYGFRWMTTPKFGGRMLRLFNRGHLEEARFIAMLLMIGAEIFQQDENGKQYRISHAEGHMGGAGDGVARGIPDLPPNVFCLTEFKTHSSASFAKLKSSGVRIAKFEHYGQMNVYMRKMGLAVGLYLAVNKDNDELYGEIIYLDTQTADELLVRGDHLVWMSSPPPKIAATAGYWKCRFCEQKPVCHQDALPARNCRTCKYSQPSKSKAWQCNLPGFEQQLDEDAQRAGCSHYEVMENLGK